MADNGTAASGPTIAWDDIGPGVAYQRVKVTWGADGTATDASAANPLPVTVTGSAAVTGTFWQATQPVSGTVTANAGSGTFAISAASLPLPAGASTAAKQPALGTAGTPSADVISVQGASGGSPLRVGNTAVVSANFTRPADTTAYAIGDLVANSTTAGSVAPLSFSNVIQAAGSGGLVRRAKIRTGNTSITNASFRIHFYAVTETSSVGDNTAIVLPSVADYRGSIDVTLDKAFADGACGFGIPAVGDSIVIDPASGTSLFALIEARAAYTPTSAQVFTVELEVLQD